LVVALGRRPSALRAECSSRGGCAVSTGDEKRLPPLEAAVNGQDRSRIGRASHHHHADHHVMARTGSARRAQIEHRLRDGRCTHRSHARWHAVHPKRNGDRTSRRRRSRLQLWTRNECRLVIGFPATNGTRLSGRNASPSVTHLSHRSTRDWTPNSALIDSDIDTDSNGVSNPSGRARGRLKRAHRGRSRHGLLR
jgi:hypothetical protein